jgi:hypothetical protein
MSSNLDIERIKMEVFLVQLIALCIYIKNEMMYVVEHLELFKCQCHLQLAFKILGVTFNSKRTCHPIWTLDIERIKIEVFLVQLIALRMYIKNNEWTNSFKLLSFLQVVCTHIDLKVMNGPII